MSGGSYGYGCFTFESTYVDRMYDHELNMLVEDFSEVLHDLEWWQSGDIDEEDYRKTVKEFKRKWFTSARATRLEGIIDLKCNELKQELLEML